MKENILLLGTFATKHLEGFGSGQLAEWEHILEKDDPDLFNWITGKQPLPADLASSAVFRQLQRHARSDPLTVGLCLLGLTNVSCRAPLIPDFARLHDAVCTANSKNIVMALCSGGFVAE
jgi:succinate dehydrogenase flavin-adding protein (antitoxin of CptAB toxin-antitoxin module)